MEERRHTIEDVQALMDKYYPRVPPQFRDAEDQLAAWMKVRPDCTRQQAIDGLCDWLRNLIRI
jgi:hypothetical protein